MNGQANPTQPTRNLAPTNTLAFDTRRSRIGILLVVLSLGLALVAMTSFVARGHPATAVATQPWPAKLEPGLQAIMQEADDQEHLRIIIHMREPDQDPFVDLPQSKDERRVVVAGRLQLTASRSQADIQRELQRTTSTGNVSFFRSLWIINGIQAAADRPTIAKLAARPDVVRISSDESLQLLEPLDSAAEAVAPALPWHLQRIKAQHAWAGLGITGTGTSIAVMDTGVDWQHPSLIDTYGGLAQGGEPLHSLAWFDAVDGVSEPFDPHGHGTHVAGTASGALGIGVAPGSTWMAVRILGPDGSGFLGDIHAGFQWLLAPNGNPTLAPDIVNGSWSGPSGLLDFLPDIEALHAAGIITVFAAGNAGPGTGTVRSPANYTDVIAVGATDDIDEVAWFSSRGPSIQSSETKPTVVAPGFKILSALPGNGYGFMSGTSMATPQVAGIMALLLSADPSLDAAAATKILTSTARLDTGVPNDDTGWGLVDAHKSLGEAMEAGRLLGVITGDGLPLPGAAINITTPSGVQLDFAPAIDGSYAAHLLSGTYSLAASAYGYSSYFEPAAIVNNANDAVFDIDLERLPHGQVSGRLLDIDSGLPVSGTIRISNAPVTATVPGSGRYEFELPVSQHELVAWVKGHLLGRLNVTVLEGANTESEIWLEPGPSVLLIDSGPWYGESYAELYAAALQDNDFWHDVHAIRDPFVDVPTTELLATFDTVVWTAPNDTPGATGGGGALSDFLDAGGNAVIAGQHAAALEDQTPFPHRWWHTQLRGDYLGKAEPPYAISGEDGTVLEGIELLLSDVDPDGRAVQPDASMPAAGSLTGVGLRYADGSAASLLGGHCEPFDLAYYGFGLEHVAVREDRRDLLATAFDYFRQPETETGLKFDQDRYADLAPPGGRRLYPIGVRNLSEVHTDTIQLALHNPAWPAEIITSTFELGPCQNESTRIEIDIPDGLPPNSRARIEVVALSAIAPGNRQTLTIDLKTPDYVLLVDDDRWYDQSTTFRNALDGAGITYDFWEETPNGADLNNQPLDLLNAYEFVFWYTGYDWFRPVTKDESEALVEYLDQGGRLFLTSQDFLYYHYSEPLARDYLGVLDYAESVTPTIAYGPTAHQPFADIGGPHALDFGPYQNHGDGLVPRPESLVSLWHDAGYPAGSATAGPDWRTVFWGIPLETLPERTHSKAINRIIGWLSDLGDTTFVADSRTSAMANRTYTLTLRYSPAGPGSMVRITNTLPVTIAIIPSTLTGGAAYNSALHQVLWSGYLLPGQSHQIAYETTSPHRLRRGDLIENEVTISYDDHELSFERNAKTWYAAPDMTGSKLTLSPQVAEAGQHITVELALVNDGFVSAPIIAQIPFPAQLMPMTGALQFTGGNAAFSNGRVVWDGWVEPGQRISVTAVVTARAAPTTQWLPVTAIIEDYFTEPVIVSSLLEVRARTSFFPLMILDRP